MINYKSEFNILVGVLATFMIILIICCITKHLKLNTNNRNVSIRSNSVVPYNSYDYFQN